MSPRLKTKAVFVCESCDKPLMSKEDGFLLYGAVCPAELGAPPLMGEPFPDTVTIAAENLSTTAWCYPCFFQKLGKPVRAIALVPHENNGVSAMAHTDAAPGGSESDFEVVSPLGATKAPDSAPVAMGGSSPPTINVGATKEVAPGAHVNAGMGVLPKNAAALPIREGPLHEGAIVRVNANHPNYAALRGRAARIERFRETEKDYVFRFAGGQPMLGRASQLDKIG